VGDFALRVFVGARTHATSPPSSPAYDLSLLQPEARGLNQEHSSAPRIIVSNLRDHAHDVAQRIVVVWAI